MTSELKFSLLKAEDINEIAILGQQLNPSLTVIDVENLLREMFELPNYICFGVYKNDKLVGISSAWTTIRFYSGKQLEVDNVIVDSTVQSKGLGKQFFQYIENWAKENNYKTIELNTYVQNFRSHKFYFNLGFSILGFHFWKKL